VHPSPDSSTRSFQSLVLACLSLAAGCTDVLSFLKLGNLFTSAMTGNTALLAIAIGQAQWRAASQSSAALLGFIVGVVLATLVSARGPAPQGAPRAVRGLLLLELVFVVACAALWSAVDSTQRALRYAVILLSALSMGTQAVVARTVSSSGVSTVVFTTPLVHMVMAATRTVARLPGGPSPSPSAGDRLYTFAAYASGALLAALLLPRHFHPLVWLPALAVLVGLACSELIGARETQRAGSRS
jgi:uncharacterized membrane protein YoaK (UPF0700 family)